MLRRRFLVSGEWSDYERINIEGTRTLLQAALNHSVGSFLYISSPSVARAGAAIVGDGAGVASRSMRGNHARSKAAAELLALEANGTALPDGGCCAWVRCVPHLMWGPATPSWWSVFWSVPPRAACRCSLAVRG